MNFIKPNLKSLPEQVDINTNDIKNLKSVLKSTYKTEKELTNVTTTIPISDTNAPQGTTSGWLYDSVGHLFSINGGDGTNLLLEYYTNLRGPAGINGVAVVQTTGTSTESVMSQNAVTNELNGKANIDASNLSSENVTSWSNKLGVGTLTTELDSKANLDASNLSNENLASWVNKLGTAKVDASNLSEENIVSWANKFFPIGSIYISVNETSPASIYGGTWEQLRGDAYFKIVTSNGGSLGGTNSEHKIPIASMPNHSHANSVKNGSYTTINGGGDTWVTIYNNDYVGYTGGGEPYYPYYYGVYAWVRVL